MLKVDFSSVRNSCSDNVCFASTAMTSSNAANGSFVSADRLGEVVLQIAVKLLDNCDWSISSFLLSMD